MSEGAPPLAQIDARAVGVGPDGTEYAAVDPAWGPVTVYRLHGADVQRRAELQRRFDRLAEWHIDRALEVKRADVGGRVVVCARAPRTLDDAIAAPLPEEQAARIALDVALALTDLHRAGIVHGFLVPASVGVDADGRARLDVSGLRCRDVRDELTAACRASIEGDAPRRWDDVWALGVLLHALVDGPAAAVQLAARGREERSTADLKRSPLHALARELVNLEPAWRPSAQDAARRLRAILGEPLAPAPAAFRATLATGEAAAVATDREDDEDVPVQLGRFRLEALIGEGAMGRVYRAVDVATGERVAVKVAGRGDEPPSPRAIKRFKKEARILAELKNPGVALLLDAGEHDELLWMAVEYVEGDTLRAHLAARGPLPERDAVALVADLCRALVDVHDRGIVHRDIKPENVLVEHHADARGLRVKLIDFGIARHLEETASLAMTRAGAVMGTPLYMSPEQAQGQHVDARSDIYALGTILYELLTGSAPFAGHGAALVISMQIEHEPPRLTEVRPDVSDDVARVVRRCLEKDPDARPQDARELLALLARIVEGEPASIAQHPLTAAGAGARGQPADGVSRWVFEWELTSTPKELWPFVSSTDRLNRAIGLGAVEEQVKLDDQGDPMRFGRTRQAGFELAWREHPYEWVLERRIGVLREYGEGPLRSLRSSVDLQELPPTANAASGAPRTKLVHTIEAEPRGVLGRAAAAVEIGVKTKRALDRVYRRIDDLVAQQRAGGAPHAGDPFEAVEALGREREERLVALEKRVVELGGAPAVVGRLGDFVRQSSAPELARMRPLALARRLGVDEDAMVRACLIAAREGMLLPLWDLLCPTCRVPAGIEETLRALKDHAHCEVCNIDFALDLATSIELVFRVHPQLRQADAATYCLSSPQKTPHVMAQVRIAPGERFLLEMSLPEGAWQLVGRRLGYALSFRTRSEAPLGRWDLALAEGPPPGLGRVLRAGRQELALVNDTGREQLVRVERTEPRDDVLTAARVAAHPLFRKLYPNEVLSPGALVRIASVVFVHAEVRGDLARAAADGDADAYAALYNAYKAIEAEVIDAGGTVVKLLGEGVLAVFDDPVAAVRAAVRFADAVQAVHRARTGPPPCVVRASVHRGPAAAVTMNERLDYFGNSVGAALALTERARDGEVIVSDDVLADPAVQRVLDDRARGGLMPTRHQDRTDPAIAIA